ncbi:MAG: DUF58 domain-containing protein [Polyangiaceae bacterium]
MNLARLNHILIPSTSAERERWRLGLVGRLTRPGWWLYSALSEEGRVLSVLVLFIGTAGLDVATSQVYYLWAALMGLLTASMVVRPFMSLRDVEAEVRVPPRVGVGAPVTFTISLRNRGDRPRHAIRIRGPFLPWDGRFIGAEARVAELAAGETEHRDVQARFIQRGRHHLDPFQACALLPLGLAVGPIIRSESCHFVVVPHIANVDRIDVPSGRRFQPGGINHASITGETMELLGVRPYRPGDALRDLHAKTWARQGSPHVREYQQEYFTRIGVVLDDDRSAVTEAGFEACVSLAAGIIAKLGRGDTLVDLAFASGEQPTVTIGRSVASLDQALDALADADHRSAWNVDSISARLAPTLDELSSLVLVTQSRDAKILGLAEEIRRRGVACIVVRVEDDTGPRWLRRDDPLPARVSEERVVLASHVLSEEPLAI